MSARSFFDSNVLVYTDDSDAPDKQAVALGLLERARLAGTGVVSTQVLQEYFATATRKLGVAAELARRKVELFSRHDMVQVDLGLILEGIDLHRLHQLSFWDGLIVAAARRSGCTVLLSENLQEGWRLGDLRVVNPFC
jgi:predicted nucleic acid-binding protein